MIKTEEIEVSLGEKSIRLNIVKNSEEILTSAINDAETPVWVELWPSSLALARWLWNNSSLKGQKVLELGAGLGLPGIAAGMRGADVLQTDYMPEALVIASENARLNNVSSLSTALADWRSFTITEQFNLIIGSDILYHPDLNPYLKKIFQNNLKPGGKIIMADAGRKDSLSFITELRQDSWTVSEEQMPVQQGPFDYRIYIFEISKL
ncbi:MAG: methyltransferase domain-containing protein [Thermincola sp.]|jgi:predicted nicotinamide N-methyase|nr:methyltransferase domain-containing protein [Thermincola sp.]MDT3703324.1 methyltransferase domain-containing protein [Thermincola sp.]